MPKRDTSSLHEASASSINALVSKHAKPAAVQNVSCLPQASTSRGVVPACGANAAIRDEIVPAKGNVDEFGTQLDSELDPHGGDYLMDEAESEDMDWEDADEFNQPQDGGVNVNLTLGATSSADNTLQERRLLAKASRQLSALQHRCSALGFLGRGLLIDAATRLPAVQAAMMSLDLPDVSVRDGAATVPDLQTLVTWMGTAFEVADTPFAHMQTLELGDRLTSRVVDLSSDTPDQLPYGHLLAAVALEGQAPPALEHASPTQLIAMQLLQCIHLKKGPEEHLAALFVCLLRSFGLLTRFVSVIDPMPRAGDPLKARTKTVKALRGGGNTAGGRGGRKRKTRVFDAGVEYLGDGPVGLRAGLATTEPEAGTPEGGDKQPESSHKRRGDVELELQLAMAMQATAQTNDKAEAEAIDTTTSQANSSSWTRKRPIGFQHWAEVWCDSTTKGRWVHADSAAGKVDAESLVEERGHTRHTLTYVVAFQGGGAKDVTRRYARSFVRSLQLRDEGWWQATIAPLRSAQVAAVAAAVQVEQDSGKEGDRRTPVDALRMAELVQKREDAELKEKEISERSDLPNSIKGFVKHPLYVLERHIQRYQALRPGAQKLGLHRGEAYYDRKMLADLHAAERWRREGRRVRVGELAVPAKAVKSRNHGPSGAAPPPGVSAAEEGAEPVTHLYGVWQTEILELPIATGGIVPKNDHGNVEVPPFVKALPGGTVHIPSSVGWLVCKRLEIDYAPALVGFEGVRGAGMVPKIVGVVVCNEYEEVIRAAVLQEEATRVEKARAKRFAQGRDAWRKLVHAVHHRVLLQQRHDAEATSNAVLAVDRKKANKAEAKAAAAQEKATKQPKATRTRSKNAKSDDSAQPVKEVKTKAKGTRVKAKKPGAHGIDETADAQVESVAFNTDERAGDLQHRLNARGVKADIEEI